MLHDPLVEALEARREQRHMLFLGELLDDGLRELPPLRRQRDHAMLGDAAVHGLERSRDDVHAQHHPRAAAVGIVVDLAGAKRRRVAVAEEAQIELASEDGRDRPLLGQPAEGMRNQREDVELQGDQVRRPRRSRRATMIRRRLEIDLPHAGLDQGQQQAHCPARGRRSQRRPRRW